MPSAKLLGLGKRQLNQLMTFLDNKGAGGSRDFSSGRGDNAVRTVKAKREAEEAGNVLASTLHRSRINYSFNRQGVPEECTLARDTAHPENEDLRRCFQGGNQQSSLETATNVHAILKSLEMFMAELAQTMRIVLDKYCENSMLVPSLPTVLGSYHNHHTTITQSNQYHPNPPRRTRQRSDFEDILRTRYRFPYPCYESLFTTSGTKTDLICELPSRRM